MFYKDIACQPDRAGMAANMVNNFYINNDFILIKVFFLQNFLNKKMYFSKFTNKRIFFLITKYN